MSNSHFNVRAKQHDANETTIIPCRDKSLEPRVDQRAGSFWVFYNYIQAEKSFHCNETITYTTHGDYTYLDNIELILKRWQGPISIAIFTPGMSLTMQA